MKKKFKKVVLPVFIGVTSLSFSITFFLGAIFGYLFGKYAAGRKVGEPAMLKSLRFSLGRYVVHLHHWFYVSLIMIIVLIGGITYFFPIFIWGFGAGFAFQGIHCYDDWHKIISIKKY